MVQGTQRLGWIRDDGPLAAPINNGTFHPQDPTFDLQAKLKESLCYQVAGCCKIWRCVVDCWSAAASRTPAFTALAPIMQGC